MKDVYAQIPVCWSPEGINEFPLSVAVGRIVTCQGLAVTENGLLLMKDVEPEQQVLVLEMEGGMFFVPLKELSPVRVRQPAERGSNV